MMHESSEHIGIITYAPDGWMSLNRFLYHAICHNSAWILDNIQNHVLFDMLIWWSSCYIGLTPYVALVLYPTFSNFWLTSSEWNMRNTAKRNNCFRNAQPETSLMRIGYSSLWRTTTWSWWLPTSGVVPKPICLVNDMFSCHKRSSNVEWRWCVDRIYRMPYRTCIWNA